MFLINSANPQLLYSASFCGGRNLGPPASFAIIIWSTFRMVIAAFTAKRRAFLFVAYTSRIGFSPLFTTFTFSPYPSSPSSRLPRYPLPFHTVYLLCISLSASSALSPRSSQRSQRACEAPFPALLRTIRHSFPSSPPSERHTDQAQDTPLQTQPPSQPWPSRHRLRPPPSVDLCTASSPSSPHRPQLAPRPPSGSPSSLG